MAAQLISFALYEAVTIVITMSPPTMIVGWTLQLNIRQNGILLLVVDYPAINDPINGVFSFPLASIQTGLLGLGTNQYDVWRLDSGNQTQLAYGTILVTEEEWQ